MDVVRGVTAAWAPNGLPGVLDRVHVAARRGPLGVALRAGVMTIAAVGAAWVHHVHDPGVLCPFRALTGVPCPLCGGTTVFIQLGGGHPAGALAANPVAFMGAAGLIVAPLGPGRRWWAMTPRTRGWIIAGALVGAELWQLARFGFLRF